MKTDGKEGSKKETSESDGSEHEDSGEQRKCDTNEMAGDGIKLKFCLNKDDWETFVERLELYFTAKDVKTEKQAAHLLTRLDEDAFKLIRQLVAPERLSAKSFADLVKVMSEQLNPKPSEVMERCKFNMAKQESNESVADFAARLKKLAMHCGFTDLKIALRDQLVCGLKDYDTRVSLFKMEKLDYDTAFKEAVAKETAEKTHRNP